MRDKGNTEVGGFGISPADDLLFVEDVRMVRQRCTAVTVQFDDEAVADFFDEQVEAGRRPEQFARIWLHTHPGESPSPSSVDEETFARVFGVSDWSVMAIVARGGRSYARIQFCAGPRGTMQLPVRVDYKRPFTGSDEESWHEEYQKCVQRQSSDFDWCNNNDWMFERDPISPHARVIPVRNLF